MQLQAAFHRYVENMKARHLSQYTILATDDRVGRFVRSFPEQEVGSVTAKQLDAWFLGLRELGLADGTLAGHKKSHRTFWRWCLSEGLVTTNPAEVLQRHQYSFRPVHSRAAPVASIKAVVDAMPLFLTHRDFHPRDLRDTALVSLAIDSAARRGEIHSLRKKDVVTALQNGELVGSGHTAYRMTAQGKTGAVTIRFFDATAKYLRLWMQCMPESPWLWVSLNTGDRLRVDVLWLAFDRLCKFANVPTFRFHATRKRTVTDVIAASGDAKMGQLLANHRDERTTQQYYNQIQEEQVSAAAAAMAAERHSEPDLARDLFGGVIGRG